MAIIPDTLNSIYSSTKGKIKQIISVFAILNIVQYCIRALNKDIHITKAKLFNILFNRHILDKIT